MRLRPTGSARRRGRLILLVAILITLGAVAVVAALQFRTDPVTEDLQAGRLIKILFILHPDGQEIAFEVFMLNPVTDRTALAYAPGNVGAIIQSLGRVDGLSVLYGSGTRETLLQHLSGLMGQEIDYYVDLTPEVVRGVVDLLGGIELFVPNPIEDLQSDPPILLPSGSIVLDGDKALDYLRHHSPLEPEIEVVSRRHKFLQALLKQMAAQSRLLATAEVGRVFQELVPTNLPRRGLRALVEALAPVDAERMVLVRVLGREQVVEGRPLLFPHNEGTLLREIVTQTLEALASQQTEPFDDRPTTIEVLNGTTTNGLAGRAAALFESYGYSITKIGNADNQEYLTTVILDRRGHLEAARGVAEVIQCERAYTRFEPQENVTADLTIILGRDFDGRFCK